MENKESPCLGYFFLSVNDGSIIKVFGEKE